MLTKWLNKQNKPNHHIFNNDDELFWFETYATWTDVYFDKEAKKLNKRISKISPRRSKKYDSRGIKNASDTSIDALLDFFSNNFPDE